VPTISNSYLRPAAISATLLMTSLTGCKARQLAVAFSDNGAKSVDSTWITAARTCWPDMNDDMFSDSDMKRYLTDPTHFRAAFSSYSELTDAQLIAIIPNPIQQAPQPDATVLSNASHPVLSRAQAVAGISAQQAINANTGQLPPDALCSIHPGTPIGFK